MTFTQEIRVNQKARAVCFHSAIARAMLFQKASRASRVLIRAQHSAFGPSAVLPKRGLAVMARMEMGEGPLRRSASIFKVLSTLYFLAQPCLGCLLRVKMYLVWCGLRKGFN